MERQGSLRAVFHARANGRCGILKYLNCPAQVKMLSLRKLSVILVVCVAGGLLIWFSHRGTLLPSTSSTNAGSRSQAGGNSSSGSSSNGTLGSVLSGERSDTAIARAGIWQGGLGDNSLGIYNESARSLMRSNSLAKIDYGFARLRSVCLSFLSGQDGVTAVKKL